MCEVFHKLNDGFLSCASKLKSHLRYIPENIKWMLAGHMLRYMEGIKEKNWETTQQRAPRKHERGSEEPEAPVRMCCQLGM